MKVLILSLHPLVPGGVSHYIELLKQNLSPTIETRSFLIGRRPDEHGALQITLRLVGDAARLVGCVLFNRYDVIHLNTSLKEKCVLRDGVLLFILRLFRVRGLLIFIHGWRPSLERRICSNGLYRVLLRWLIGRRSCVIVLAESFKNSLVAMGVAPAQIKLTRTMFDGNAIRREREPAAGKPGKQVILFLSRFEEEKGVYELLEAFARIKDRIPSAELVMAGGGQAHEGLRRRVEDLGLSDRVRLLNYQRGAAKTNLLAQARIFALPTYYGEGMPVALLEAMAAGSVVLTSRVGGIPSVVSDPDNGVLLDKISVESVEAGLTRLLEDQEYCTRAGKTNMERAWKHFEAGTVTKEVERLYMRLAGGKWPAGPAPSKRSERAQP